MTVRSWVREQIARLLVAVHREPTEVVVLYTMVGMLLAGAPPIDAVRLQLILLSVLLGASRSAR